MEFPTFDAFSAQREMSITTTWDHPPREGSCWNWNQWIETKWIVEIIDNEFAVEYNLHLELICCLKHPVYRYVWQIVDAPKLVRMSDIFGKGPHLFLLPYAGNRAREGPNFKFKELGMVFHDRVNILWIEVAAIWSDARRMLRRCECGVRTRQRRTNTFAKSGAAVARCHVPEIVAGKASYTVIMYHIHIRRTRADDRRTRALEIIFHALQFTT